ncbi:MAG: aldo/keto reductase [Desulfuromonadales bacterium]
MNYRQLGATGISISEIGFGGWGIGGVVGDAKAYGPTDDKVSLMALNAAFDEGITFYDTSPLYGYGHSENLIGSAFRQSRHKVVISSKVGYVDFSGKQDFSPDFICRSLDDTLRRLQTDYLDVYQLHDPLIDYLEEHPEVFETLEHLRKEGKIRVAGISLRNPADSLIAVTRLGFKSIQVNFSLVDQRALELDIFSICHAHGAGIIVRTPLCFGFLTGQYGASDLYHDGDHRKRWKPEQISRWAEAYKLFTAELAAEEQTNAQIALRYVLSYDAVSTTIPGMLTDGQVRENAASSQSGPFSAPILKRFSEIYRHQDFII